MSSPEDIDRRLVALEEGVAHQDRFVQQLDEVVRQIRDEYDAQQRALERRIELLELSVGSLSESPDPDEKPPHY